LAKHVCQRNNAVAVAMHNWSHEAVSRQKLKVCGNSLDGTPGNSEYTILGLIMPEKKKLSSGHE